uniref:LETM1 domain-containing protein LETM2, mitochondrial-like n=1 Tax=Euleptes europaea TaxID=460621 RepID=UPI002541FF8C|nr:LETM1 domain-containing protein LETM2, mitochondrial-like [Euleptes europaea]
MKPKPIAVTSADPLPSKDAEKIVTSEDHETLVDSAPRVQGSKSEEFITQPTEKLPVPQVSVSPPASKTKIETSRNSKASANGV